ncbi:MAG: phosphatase PAP2 family protein [Methyloversatilis sp.]|nr:phosphatase PAP2 family protein [Methyloversatilis sp.]MBP6195214.1 phosphatase PAP2 family protein [Methyloversatilis sp.]
MKRNADLMAVALASVVFALWSNRWSGFDLWLTTLLHDPSGGGFPLRRDGIGSMLLHDGVKWMSVVGWMLLVSGWVFLRLRERGRLLLRRRFGFVAGVSLAAVLAVNLLRAMSEHSCPWHLAGFGGTAQFYRLFDALPAHPGPGHCLPSGHAAGAFMWLAALPVLSVRARKAALAGTLGLGLFAGAVQIARGAHFLSHILLSAAVCSLVALAAALILSRKRVPE